VTCFLPPQTAGGKKEREGFKSRTPEYGSRGNYRVLRSRVLVASTALGAANDEGRWWPTSGRPGGLGQLSGSYDAQQVEPGQVQGAGDRVEDASGDKEMEEEMKEMETAKREMERRCRQTERRRRRRGRGRPDAPEAVSTHHT